MKHIEDLKVFFENKEVGTLLLGDKGKIYFTYAQKWLSDGFNISPLDFKFDTSIQLAKDSVFKGLHGVFNDSISDGWGLMLTDRALKQKYNWNTNTITPLDRLFFMGNRAMGGLEYLPQDKEIIQTKDLDIPELFQENSKILSGEKEEIVKELYLSGGSPGGARPKAVFAKKDNHYISGYGKIPNDYESWILKFFGTQDNNSAGKVEKAYSDMAKDFGIIMPETELLNININNVKHSFFAIKRFDREKNNKYHIVSVAGLLYASHRYPSMSYEDLAKLTFFMTKDQKEVERLFDLMLFNIVFNNQDDHSKNFSFRFKDNKWELSPGYDLTYSVGPANEHMSDLFGNGNPGEKEIIKFVKMFNIKNYQEKLENIKGIAGNWGCYADIYEIPKIDKDNIAMSISKNLKLLGNNFSYKKM